MAWPVTVALLAAVLVWSLPSGSVASSLTFVVDSLDDGADVEPGDGICATEIGMCTLRAAVEEANALGGSHEVVLGAGVHQVGPGASFTIEVTGDISITGAGRSETTISQHGQDWGSIFRVLEGASLSLSSLTLTQEDGENRWIEGVVLGRDGASFVADDVLFAGLQSAGVAAWQTGLGAPSDVDVRIADSAFEPRSSGYDVFVHSPGGSTVELVRNRHVDDHRRTPLFVAGETGGPGGNSLRIIDSLLTTEDDWWDGLQAYGGWDVEILGTTISGFGSNIRHDGGSLLVSDSAIDDAASIGIVAWGGASITVERSVMTGNGSAIDLVGSLRVVDSTIANNGSGIDQGFTGSTPAEVVNSTISGNFYRGVNLAPGSTLTNVTIVGNGHGPPGDVGWDGEGLSFPSSGGEPVEFTMRNTVIAHNGIDCVGWGSHHIDGGHNADGDGTCGFDSPGDQSGIDPMLGPLADNGGPTPTHLPMPGSPLIDAGDDDTCPATDQRGGIRPVDGTGDGIARCDVGAVEAGADVVARTTVAWSGSPARRGMLRPDEPVIVTATSQPGGQATASIVVDSWYPGADVDEPLLDAATPATVDVPLEEVSAGTYRGELSLHGIARISSIDAEVALDGSELQGSAQTGLPVTVAGALDLDTALGVPAWMLPLGRTVVGSPSTGDGDSLVAPVEGTVRTRWLLPGEGYEVQVVDTQQRRVAEPVGPTQVRGGLVVPVEVAPDVFPHVPLSVLVQDANEEPRAGVKVTVTDLVTGDEIAKRTTGPDGVVEAVARGDTVAIALDPLDTPYLPVDDVIELSELDQEVVVELGAALPTAVVSGVVDHPQRPPVPGARVTFSSKVGNRTFTTATRTTSDGTYSAVVFQGDVTVAVDEPRAGRAEETVAVTGDTVVDLMLTGPLLIDVEFELLTRYAEQPAPMVAPITGIVGFHMSLFVHSGRNERTGVGAPNVQVPVHAGETLQFCADGHKVGLPAACVDVDVDVDQQTGTASLLLEQDGRIQGAVGWPSVEIAPDVGSYRPEVVITLFRVEGGRLVKVRDWRHQGTGDPEAEQWTRDFAIPVFEPGEYEVRFEVHDIVHIFCGEQPWLIPTCGNQWWGSRYASVRATVETGSVIDLGVIPTSPRGAGFASADTFTSVSPTELLAGQTATARVSLHNTSDQQLTDARLRLELPPQTELVAGSVMLRGAPAAHGVDGGVVEVPVGDVAPGEVVAATAWVALADDFEAPGLSVIGSVAVGGVTTELGVGAAAVRRLTLDAVNLTSQLTVPVWGRAIPGGVVEVTLDGVPAATAMASPGGLWSAVVTLPEVPLPRRFSLQAEADGPDGPIRSEVQRVTYDPSLPTLRKVELHQSSGRLVTIDPAQGVALFPYTYWAFEPILLDLDFDEPHRVEPPTVWVGSATADATYDPSTGLWRAAVHPTGSQLGDVRIAWEPVQYEIDLAPAEPVQPPTDAQVRAYLPPTLATFSRVELIDDTVGAPAVEIDFPDFPDEQGAAAITTLSIDTEEVDYEPTADDLEMEGASGVALWALQLERRLGSDGEPEIEISFVIPRSALNTQSFDGAIVGMRATPQSVGGTTASFLARIRWQPSGLEAAWMASSAVNDIDSAIGSADFLRQLEGLLDSVERRCDPTWAATYRSQIDDLQNQYLLSNALTVALLIGGLVLAPETLGLGTLAAAALAEAINQSVSAGLDALLDQVRGGIDVTCEPEPTSEPETEMVDYCPPEGNLVPAALGGPFCMKIAKPKWIHDPSGYVYDVFEDNRLEGVTATVQHAPSPDGPWTIWDAEWYLQENPLFTDADGRYGWDVPEGWWRVRWDLDGYETAYSDALEVLPPHFDVNAGLRNLAVPDVAEIRAWGGRTAIDVEFDLWMDAATFHAGNVELRDSSDDLVDATAVPVDVAVAASGSDVATVLSVDVGRALETGESFSLVLDRMMASAGDVTLGDDVVIEITVVDPPPEAQVISFAPLADVTYGSAPRALDVSATSGLPVIVAALGPCAIQAGKVAVTGVGTCQLTASQPGDDDWLPADPVDVSFSVLPASLTVRANDVTSTVGDVPPVYGATATGLVGGDTLASLGAMTCVSSAPVHSGQLSTPGTFTIACSGLSAPNYVVSYQSGSHVVTAAAPVEPPPSGNPPSTPAPSAPPTTTEPAAIDVVPLQPARLLDTRSPLSTIDGESAGDGVRPAGSVTVVRVAGRGGVPADAAAAVFNLTVVEPEDPGYASVYPCGQPVPNASNVNFLAGVTVPNAVVTKLGADGTVCVFTSAAAQLLIDVNAYIPSGSAIETLPPARLLDTRSPLSTIDGESAGDGVRPAGSVTVVPVAGRGGVSPGAVAAVLNVTIVDPADDGYATVFPCGEPVPNASNLNFRAGVSVANSAAVARLGADGAVCVFTSSDTHLLADLNGQIATAAGIEALSPARLYDSRGPGATIDGAQSGGGVRSAGSVTQVQVAGRGGVAPDAVAAVLNVTAVEPGDAGYASVFPCDLDVPNASNLNFLAGAATPNAVVAKLAADGSVCVFTSADLDLLVDVNAHVVPP